ncbi:MAG: NPCBM/NEW2 domain-containing protein [Planctomycetota bacterium]|nr:NPCBM/NEW2 domain-containing protein [Planctomycetota bacterium]
MKEQPIHPIVATSCQLVSSLRAIKLAACGYDGQAACCFGRVTLTVCLTLLSTLPLHPEEIWLANNTRVYGLIESISEDGKVGVLQPTGEVQKIPLEGIIAIRFLGRSPLLVQSGTQEFRFVQGGRLRGQILKNAADDLSVSTSFAGELNLNLSHFRGFVGLPMSGFTSRKAEELVDSEAAGGSVYKDVVLDRRGSTISGVIRKVERTALDFDIDDILQVRPFKTHYLKGVRLADAGRDKRKAWDGKVQVLISTRDGSSVQGHLSRIHLGRWTLKPIWDESSSLVINFNDIALVQTLGGRVQYLSQLEPTAVKEQTILAPPQPYQMDRSSQGDSLSIAGKRYPWGIGVHADSEINFELGGRFNEFRSDAGISTTMGDRGSVVFSVFGDERELFKSNTVRGSDAVPLAITVNVAGVKNLTLKVTNGDDLDLGDVANWGSARVLR